jgi:hypothetical protein
VITFVQGSCVQKYKLFKGSLASSVSSDNTSCPKDPGSRSIVFMVSEARFRLPNDVEYDMKCQQQCEMIQRSKDPHCRCHGTNAER